jgi:hypothetical protein
MSSQYDSVFNTVQSIPPQLAVSNNSHTATNTVPVIVTIDSYGLALNARNKYSVSIDNLAASFRDVVSIELIQAFIPPADANDLFLILNVNGYSKVTSNNNNARTSFCLIPATNPGNDTYYNMRRTSSIPDDNYVYYFSEPTRISKLDIEFTRPDGSAPATNVTNGNGFNGRHHVLTFEIRTLNRAPKADGRYRGNVTGPW